MLNDMSISFGGTDLMRPQGALHNIDMHFANLFTQGLAPKSMMNCMRTAISPARIRLIPRRWQTVG